MPVHHPDRFERRVVFSFGVNDCVVEEGRRRVRVEDSVGILSAVLRKVPTEWKVLVVGPPPAVGEGDEELTERIFELDGAMWKVCGEAGMPFVSVFDRLSSCEVWEAEVTKGDGIHPSSKGYRTMSDLVWRSAEWRTWLATESP
jgi:acyl-CoA thioesterase I